MYRQHKTAQIAAIFLERSGGNMDYMKLLKLLYYADRQKLLRHGTPMTFDRWYAMKHGPVLSHTYNLIKNDIEVNDWTKHIHRNGYSVILVADPGSDEISRADKSIIDDVFREHGHKDTWTIVNEIHQLGEWEDPGSTSDEITVRMILEVEGVPLAEIQNVIQNIEAENAVDRILLGAN